MSVVVNNINGDQSTQYQSLLYPKANKSYHSNFLKKFDYSFINIKESYNRTTNGMFDTILKLEKIKMESIIY